MVADASVWIPRADAPSFLSLSGDVVTDVVIVGAGISGLTTAVLLQRAGHDVVVVEMHRVATGTTGQTTGKVTSQHGLIYACLVAEHGEEKARMYGEANEAGLAMVAELAAEASADCDLTRSPAYVYTTDDSRVADVEREATVAARLGLPAVLADPAEVPFEHVRAAVRFHDQLHLDAYRYCTAWRRRSSPAVVRSMSTLGRRVRERSDQVVVETDHGSIRANHAVIATLLPFVDAGGFFARARAPCPWSRRTTPEPGPRRDVHHRRAAHPVGTAVAGWWAHGIIVVGEEHETGSDRDTEIHYQRLEEWAGRR